MPPKTNVNYARSYQVLTQSINALVKPATPANAPVVPLATVTTVMTWVSQNGGATNIRNAIAAADNIRARIGRSWPTNANNNNRAMPPNTPVHPASGLRIAWLDTTALANQASRKQFCENLAAAYVTQGFHRDMNTCTPVQAEISSKEDHATNSHTAGGDRKWHVSIHAFAGATYRGTAHIYMP